MKLMDNSLLAATLLCTSLAAQAVDLTGAGATFPAPIYAKWAEAYKAATGHAINYQPIGSGGGIKQIKARTVDFGASDDPLPAEELDKQALVQFPAVIGGVVMVVNLPGIAPGRLTLDANVIAAIYSGQIRKWNDPLIGRLNPGIGLPDQAITPVYRSDSSGTTAVFTGYLAEVVPAFGSTVGAGKTINWPSGIGGKGNAGVAASVLKLNGSIGYVEYAYAKQNRMTHTGLVNRAGKTVQPDASSFAAAAAGADWSAAPGLGISLNNQGADDAWPITSASFILMHRTGTNPEKTTEVLRFFRWALEEGGQLALGLDYVPMPEATLPLIEAAWQTIGEGTGAGMAAVK